MRIETFNHGLRGARGFSLIEVMVAALVLATGLLSLAALQSALTRNSADARARSQISAFVDLVIERQRSLGSTDFDDVPSSTQWSAAELASVSSAAGVSNLAVTVTSTLYEGRSGTFVACDAICANGLVATDPQYKQVKAVATWTDSIGNGRRFDMSSIVSPRSIADSRVPFDSPTSGPTAGASPVVRTATPVEAGVIPIAIGDGSDTAATNPEPTISSGNVIRTSYEVLTYKNESATTVRQQRRVETAIVGCSCLKGTAATGAQFERAQWPAFWNGERYEIYAPTSGDTPGTAQAAAPDTSVVQDPLCVECCRDHHGGGGAGDIKFDPFRSDDHTHYKLSGDSLVVAGAADSYLEACRMIRVDGFWRTAQDLDSKHFGLLKTESFAQSAVPENNVDTTVNSAVEFYEQFVIDFLKSNYLSGQTVQSAASIYEAKGLNAPAQIEISRPTPRDERYLHARGLYVDKVEPIAQAKIDKAFNACTRAEKVECILPYLAFTSINVTEAAFWSPSDTDQLTVDSDGFVVFNPSAPNRGRVNALATATPDRIPTAMSRMNNSNSGLSVRDKGIDPDDDIGMTDSQVFKIRGGVGTGITDEFSVSISGLSDLQTPGVGWEIGSSGNNCQGDGSYNWKCMTSVALGGASKVIVSAYNRQDDLSGTVTITCPTGDSYSYTANGQRTIPYCRNFTITSVKVGGVDAGTTSTANNGNVGGSERNISPESTTVEFASIVDGAVVTIGFGWENGTEATSTTIAPVLQCTFKNNGGLSQVTFSDCP